MENVLHEKELDVTRKGALYNNAIQEQFRAHQGAENLFQMLLQLRVV